MGYNNKFCNNNISSNENIYNISYKLIMLIMEPIVFVVVKTYTLHVRVVAGTNTGGDPLSGVYQIGDGIATGPSGCGYRR